MPSTTRGRVQDPVWLQADDCNIIDFTEIVEQATNLADYPYASRVELGVIVYDCGHLRDIVGEPTRRREVQAEMAHALLHGPGVFALAGAFADMSVLDRVTSAFRAMIAAQQAEGHEAGDHFAKPGANDRIWNALEKLALADPDAFADYYANDMIALASVAWLGPSYQMTSQVNQVNPGGAAQLAHVDYHLGFQSNEVTGQYPAHVHALSAALTLQGAVAHCDMPIESGPTMYLPHSQKYALGYLAWRHPEFRAYFDANYVQLALAKGDAVFFNPSLFHAAGHNTSTDIQRIANLLQVSSAFGRTMETVDRDAMIAALYPTLLQRRADGANEQGLRNIIAVSAEGYAFPTNLDRDPPIEGLAPASQADIVWTALRSQSEPETLAAQLHALRGRRSLG